MFTGAVSCFSYQINKYFEMDKATEPNPMERPSGSGFGAAQSENDEQYSRERKERTKARQTRDGDQR